MVGFDIDTRAYYTSVTSIIAIPTGMKIMNWLASIWSGCSFLTNTLFWIIGFLYSFSFGGFSGLVLANVVLDVVLHDTYFVVSHFHYVLSLGAVYTIYSSFYNYWMLFSSYFSFNDFLGRIHFSTFFISSNLIFFSMHSWSGMLVLRSLVLFFRFHWLNSFGLVGVIFSLVFFILAHVFITLRRVFKVSILLFYIVLLFRSMWSI
jgi:heme/copper-type cytochrome/quinol oxidase subunit 1